MSLNRDDLLRRVADKRDDVVALTQTLVRIPTVNPPGCCYEDCTRLIGERLSAAGFDVRFERARGAIGDSDRFPRSNVIARREGARPGPTVHFNGHIDVVTAGSGWHTEPFAATLIDGRIYGRGTSDMKGGLAAAIVAAESLIEADPRLPGTLEISGTADEESGGYGGVAYLAELGYFSRPRVDHVIIPEPLDKDRVCLGHRGVWWASLETFGRMAHGSMPFLGDSAIRHMGAVLESLERDLYPRLAAKRTAMPVVPDGARASTLNVNSIHGGEGEGFDGLPAPLVADSCRLVLDRRFLIEEDLAEVKAEIRSLLDDLSRTRAGFRYRLTDLFEVVPSQTERDAPVAAAVARAVAEVLRRPAQFVVSPGTYDQKHIDRIGRLDSCIAYGPGILDLAHQPDEYVVVDDLVDAAQVMALAAHDLLHGTVR